MTTTVERVDAFQRRHPKIGLPLAVVYKFFDDQGVYLAALIAFYGFLSLFPLLLLAATILNYVLSGDIALQKQVLNSALGQFPIVGDQLADPRGVSGSGVGLAVGIIGTLYGGLGVAQAAQNAMNNIWRVPRNSRPNPFLARWVSIRLLLVVGLAILGTTILSGLGSNSSSFGADIGSGWQALLVGASMIVNAAVFTLGFKVATARHLTWRETVPGAVIAAVSWQVLQVVGSSYVGGVVKNAKAFNGVFALVLGLLVWIYIEAIVVVLAVEYNVVRSQRLWPRALLTPFTDNVELTAADEAAYTQQARATRLKGFQDIEVRFEPHQRHPAADDPADPDGPGATPPPPPHT